MIAAVALLMLVVPAGLKPAGEIITEVRIHGNHVTSDDEILKLSGITIGAAVGPTTLSDISARLRASRKFDDVNVLKRFASIADPTKIVVVIIVNEGPVRIDLPDTPGGPLRVVKRRGLRNLMVMPILDAEDGYGATYGARLAFVHVGGERGRVSFPLTWGGLKQAGAEFDRTFEHGPLTRIAFGGDIDRRKNPAYAINDDRRKVWGRAERAMGPLRTNGIIGWQRVTFANLRDEIRSVGAEVVFDTRIDPVLPRNAVYAGATVERLDFASGGATVTTSLDGRAFIGLLGQTTLVLRATRESANHPLPLYLRYLLGGWSNLRGFKAGTFTGDTLVAGSAELRIPLTSPLDVGKLGVSVFVDTGTAYDKGQRFNDQPLRTGIGASVWITAAMFRIGIAVAHGRGATTRVNFGANLTY